MEAVFVGTILVTAAVAVTSLEVVPPSVEPDRFLLEDLVRDVLDSMEALPTGDRYGRYMDKTMIQAMQDNAGPLESILRRVMPAGTECRLWLDDGTKNHLLLGDPDFVPRGSVSASKLYRPSWAYGVMFPTLSVITPEQPLQIQGFGVSKASLLKQAGIPVQVTVNTTEGFYHKSAVVSVAQGPTVAITIQNNTGQPDYAAQDTLSTSQVYQRDWAGPPSADSFTMLGSEQSVTVKAEFTGSNYNLLVTFTSPSGIPVSFPAVGISPQAFDWILPVEAGTWTVSSTSTLPPLTSKITVTAQVVGQKTSWLIEFREHGGVTIEAGTRVKVQLPGYFDAVSSTGVTKMNFVSKVGTVVTAEFSEPLSNDVAILQISGNPHAQDKQSAFAFVAEVEGLSRSRAVLIVGDPTSQEKVGYPLPRGFNLNIPHPVAPGSVSDWGLVFNYAHTATSVEVETIRQIDLKTPNGEALFESVAYVEPPAGPNSRWERLGPDHLRWTGSLDVKANQAKGMRFQVGVVPEATSYEAPPRIPVSFDSGHVINASEFRHPHVFQLTVPPNGVEPGYHPPQSISNYASLANVTWIKGANKVEGSVAYNLTTYPPLQALQDSIRVTGGIGHLNISRTNLQHGDTAIIEADFRQLEDSLATNGVNFRPLNTLVPYNWRVNLSVFDPTQPLLGAHANWTPLASVNTTEGNVTLSFTPAKGGFAGPHVVLGQATFDLADVRGDVLTETASLLGVIEVGRDWSESGTSVYWATLECWLPDW